MLYSRHFLVRFEPDGRNAYASQGTSILEAARKVNINIGSTCKGQGDCGECTIVVISGDVSSLSDIEEDLIKTGQLLDDQRLACCTRVIGNVTVRLV